MGGSFRLRTAREVGSECAGDRIRVRNLQDFLSPPSRNGAPGSVRSISQADSLRRRATTLTGA
jgi:hypothetical protein